MAKDYTFMTLLNWRCYFRISPYTFNKIKLVIHVGITTGAYGIVWIGFKIRFNFFYKFICGIINFVIASAIIYQCAFISIDDEATSTALNRIGITTAPFPGDGFLITKFE